MERTGYEPTLAEVERYSTALAAAAEPAAVMDAATLKFQAMEALARAGDHENVAKAARLIVHDCLRVCVVPADSERGAGDNVRFLSVMVRWAWLRNPALAALMAAAIEAERLAWGDYILV